MTKFIALLYKEALVLSKDIHGLLILFIMPAVFILIMSLAMQNAFDEQKSLSINYIIVDYANNDASAQFITRLQSLATFKAHILEAQTTTAAQLKKHITGSTYKFGVIIPENFAQQLFADSEATAVLKILLAPTVKPYMRELFGASLRSELIKQKVTNALSDLNDAEQNTNSPDPIENISNIPLQEEYLYSDKRQIQSPSSVQQNVPAWLVFAMFFVIVPISTAFIVEKQQGTFVRLRVMNLSANTLLLAKLLPYYTVNQIQMVFMLLVGMYLVPLLGGDELNMTSSFAGLIIISSAASYAAIGFALLVATFAKTTVQATTLGGIFNLIFGALGGIMVPIFVMPPVMQNISVVSPMSWGLQGFLDVFLRNSNWAAVLPEAAALITFGTLCLVLAAAYFRKLV